MKIFHTADLHLGMHPDKGQPWSGKRAGALWDTFRHIIESAGQEQADLLIIAGDLFHSQPLLRDLKEVNSCFQTLSRTQVILIAGNHDPVTARSHYLDFPWAENVFFLSGPSMDSVFFPELNTEVHGFSYHQSEIRERRYDSLRVPDDGRIHILAAHGGDEKHIPIDLSRLAAAGFHYVALGHIHKPELHEQLRLAWCGSPEPLDCTDIGPRGYIVADVTARQTRLRFVPCQTAQYIPLNVSVTPETTREELRCALSRTTQEEGLSNLFLISLTGERSPETDFSEPIPLHARIARWNDRTRPALDEAKLRREHSSDLLGLFFQEMDHLPAGELRDKALAYGIRACMGEGDRL